MPLGTFFISERLAEKLKTENVTGINIINQDILCQP
jgi:hypothetical protein